MWDPLTERNRIANELAETWWHAQHLVWHSADWDAAMAAIDDLEQDLGRLDRLSPPSDRVHILDALAS